MFLLKQLLHYLKQYTTNHFNAKVYLLTGVFLSLCIWANYQFNIHASIQTTYHDEWIYFPIMTVFMAFPFLVITGFSFLGKEKPIWLRSKEFWIKCAAAFLIIGFERSFFLHKEWGQALDAIDWKFYINTMAWGRSFLSTFIVSLCFYWIYERPWFRN